MRAKPKITKTRHQTVITQPTRKVRTTFADGTVGYLEVTDQTIIIRAPYYPTPDKTP